MARILLHTLVFAPDGVSTSTLLSELMQDLKAAGHQVTILTTKPHYNRDEEAENRQPLHKRFGGLYYVSEHYGMRVIHTYMPRKGQGINGRIRDFLLFHALSLVLGLLMLGRQDVVIVPSPPLSIGVIGWLLAKLKGGAFIYNIRELYPDVAVQMGLTQKNSLLYRFMAWMEKFVYQRSKTVVVICEQFRRHVIRLGISPEKVVTIRDFVDVDFIRPLPKENEFSLRHEIANHFVVLYAGNIGLTQSFTTIMEVARRVGDLPEILFLIIGDGANRDYVIEQVRQYQLSNVKLLPYQPRSDVPLIYASANLSLVPLMAGTAQTTIPSKVYTIMASGRPVLASVDTDSELTWIIDEARCGLAVPPDDAEALETAIRQMYAMPQELVRWGDNGRAYAEIHYSRRFVNKQFDQLIQNLVIFKHVDNIVG